MTSKLQVTIPKVIAEQYAIAPGKELNWLPAGDSIRVVLATRKNQPDTMLGQEERLALFDAAVRRQKEREKRLPKQRGRATGPADRGWTREELYRRGRPD